MPAHDPYAPARPRPAPEETELTRQTGPSQVSTIAAAGEAEAGPDYEALKRDQLIEIAHRRGLRTWGTRPQLIERLRAYDQR